MKVKLVAYGIARDILNGSEQDFKLKSPASISDLKHQLMTKFPAFKALRSLRFAVNEDYQMDTYQLQEDDEVVIIPPVSGG